MYIYNVFILLLVIVHYMHVYSKECLDVIYTVYTV